MTATSEHDTTSNVQRTSRVYQNRNDAAIRTEIAKYPRMIFRPWIRSPTICAKPVTWKAMLELVYFARIASRPFVNAV